MATVVAIGRYRHPNRSPVARQQITQALKGMRYFPAVAPPCHPGQGERLVRYEDQKAQRTRLICSLCGKDPRNPGWTP